MPLGVWPAVFANGCDIKRILAGDECSLSGDRAVFLPSRPVSDIVLGRIEAVQHRFHRWGKKSKISVSLLQWSCRSPEVLCSHCCKFVANSCFPSSKPDISEKVYQVETWGRERLFLSSCSPGNTSRIGGRKLNSARLLMSNGLCLWAECLPTGRRIVRSL